MTMQSLSVEANASEEVRAAYAALEAKRPSGARRAGSMRVEVTRAAIVRAGASPLLAIDPSIIGRGVMLEPPRPTVLLSAEMADDGGSGAKRGKRYATAAHVTIRGPLSQRASWEMCGGYIDGYDAVVERFAGAHSDVEVDAVIVEIDSCGGDVAGLEQCVAKMREVNARSGKPVFFFINEACYSAAYWIAAAVNTNGISLPEAAGVGSIGVISGWVDETGALEQEGVAVHLVRFPAGKAESHSLAPIADLADARIKARTEVTGKRFIAAMAAARGLDADAILGFNGDTFNGGAAVKAGLADKIETFESLVTRAQTAGRQWRRSKESAQRAEEQKMSDQAELETLRTFKTKALATFDAKTDDEYFGKATAAKAEVDGAPERNAKAAANEQNLKALQKQSDDREAKAAIDAAQAIHKVVPSSRAAAEAIYTDHGLKVLHVHLNALVPVAPAASAAAVEPRPAGATPAQLLVAGAGSAPAAIARFENMTPGARYAYGAQNGEGSYEALKQDWISRGSPAAT